MTRAVALLARPALLTTCVLNASACAHPAVPPTMPTQATAEQRQAVYEENRLVQESNWFAGYSWTRKDGEYNFGEIEDLARISPETEEIYSDTKTRGIVIGIPAAAGGALIGWALADEIIGPDTPTYDARVAFYAVGGGLIVTAIIMTVAWDNPIEGFAATYNDALREQLGLSSGTAEGVSLTKDGLKLAF